MNKKIILKNAENFVKKALEKECTGHDRWHIKRVSENAKLINKTEKGDSFVISLAAVLHDIGDRKVIGKDDDDYSIAENFLKKQKVSGDIIDDVMFIIKNMSFSKTLTNKIHDASIEFYIVQDADRLDAIGAIGIARAFAYGGNRGRLLYDPTKKAQKFTSTKSYHKLNSSTLHHFEEKLLLLKDLMNTKTAKRIARARTKFMEKYLEQFQEEWNGRR